MEQVENLLKQNQISTRSSVYKKSALTVDRTSQWRTADKMITAEAEMTPELQQHFYRGHHSTKRVKYRMNFGQASLPCDICDSADDVFWNCVDCKANLCEKCYNEHLKGNPVRVFKNHNIVPVEEALRSKYTDEPCKQHPVNVYILHCNNCLQLVCPSCIIGDHKGHSLCKIEDAMSKAIQDIMQYGEQIEMSLLPQCNSLRAKIQANIKECDDWYTRRENQVKNKRRELITDVHCLCDEMLQTLIREKVQCMGVVEQDRALLEATVIELQIVLDAKNEVMKKGNSEIIEFMKEKPEIEDIMLPTVTPIHFPNYMSKQIEGLKVVHNYRTLDEQDIPHGNTENYYNGTETLFRNISYEESEKKTQDVIMGRGDAYQRQPLDQPLFQDINIQRRLKLQSSVHNINANCTDTCSVWVSSLNSKELTRVNIKGEKLKVIKSKFKIGDFKIIASDEIVITHPEDKSLQRISGTGRVIGQTRTYPYRPSGICLTRDRQYIAVCLYDKNKASVLQVLTRDGKLVQTIVYTDRESSEYYLQRVATSESGDYCIAHSGLCTVYMISSTGSLRFTYCGNTAAQYTGAFYPQDIACDQRNHLIVSDAYYNSIHMLDQEGHFLRYLLNYTNHGILRPCGLSLDSEGKLWVGQKDGTLLVVMYFR